MVATSDRRIAQRVVALREYDNREHYVPAFNFKLSDLHAALALAQLAKLPKMVRLRREAARTYRTLLNGYSRALQLPTEGPGVKPVYFRFVVRGAVDAGTVIRALREKGIECGKPVFKPLHRYLKQTGFPGADLLQKSSLSLPLYPGLTKKEIAVVARQVVQQMRGRV
jgi:perosamine synthetase